MPSSLDRRRAIIQKLLAVGATADGPKPNGVSGRVLLNWIVGPSSTYHSFSIQSLRNELNQMVQDINNPVERVGPDQYRLSTTAEGRAYRNQLNQQARGESDDDCDEWWECVYSNGDD